MREFVKRVVSFGFSLPAAACRLTGELASVVTKLASKTSGAVCDLGCAACSGAETLTLRVVDEAFDAVERLTGTLPK
jgi:hypothetical protein